MFHLSMPSFSHEPQNLSPVFSGTEGTPCPRVACSYGVETAHSASANAVMVTLICGRPVLWPKDLIRKISKVAALYTGPVTNRTPPASSQTCTEARLRQPGSGGGERTRGLGGWDDPQRRFMRPDLSWQALRDCCFLGRKVPQRYLRHIRGFSSWPAGGQPALSLTF